VRTLRSVAAPSPAGPAAAVGAFGADDVFEFLQLVRRGVVALERLAASCDKIAPLLAAVSAEDDDDE
jgi:hypothetical protein